MSELDGFQQLKSAVTDEFCTSLAVHRASSVLLKYVSFEIHGLFLNTLLVKVPQEKGAHRTTGCYGFETIGQDIDNKLAPHTEI